MGERFQTGASIKVRLSKKHTLDGELVEHAAKLIRYHLDGEWADVELERHHSIDERSSHKIHTLSVSVSQLVAVLLLFFLFAIPARAQDIGNVGLRTVNAVVANGATCTGSQQNFTTAQNIGTFANLGQTSHLATAASTASAFQMEIDGIDNIGNVFRLSDLQLGVPSSAKGGLVVTASGYMPIIQIRVTCTVGATFSISYSGSFSPQPPNFAGALLNSVDKLPFQTAAANTNSSVTFQSPTGNSAGTIIFQYAAAGPSGSTVTAQCLSNSGTNLSLYTFSPTTATTPQLFQVAASTCPFVTLTYTSGGASATTYNLEYVFNSAGTTNTAADPCLSSTTPKKSASISISTGTTTSLVAPVAGQVVYPCGIDITATWNGTNFTYQWEYGTGAACGTGTTVLSGAKSLVNNTVINDQVTGPTLLNIPVGNGLCILTTNPTAAGAGVFGFLSYVQQ